MKNNKSKVFYITVVALFVILAILLASIIFYFSNKRSSQSVIPNWVTYRNNSGSSFQHPQNTAVFSNHNGELLPASPSDMNLVITGTNTQVSGTNTPNLNQDSENHVLYNIQLTPHHENTTTSLEETLNSGVKTLLADTNEDNVDIAPFNDGQGMLIRNKDPNAAFNSGAVLFDGQNIITVTGDSANISDINDPFRQFVGSFIQQNSINDNNSASTTETPIETNENEYVSAYAGGGSGLIYHFDSSTWEWEQMNTGITNRSIYGIWGIADNDVYAVTGISSSGENGTILHYNGHSWSQMNLDSVNWKENGTDLYSIAGTSREDIYAVGQYGTILHYDGHSWKRVDGNVTDKHLNAVWASSENVYVAGIDGTILHRYNLSRNLILNNIRNLFTVKSAFAIGGSQTNPDNIMNWEKIRSGQSEVYYSIWGTSGYVAISGEKYSNNGNRHGIVAYCRNLSCTFSQSFDRPPFHGIWGVDETNELYVGSGTFENASINRMLLKLNSVNGSQLGPESKTVISSIWKSRNGMIFAAGYNSESDSPAITTFKVIDTSAGTEISDSKIQQATHNIYTVWGTTKIESSFTSEFLETLSNLMTNTSNRLNNLGEKIVNVFSNRTTEMTPLKTELEQNSVINKNDLSLPEKNNNFSAPSAQDKLPVDIKDESPITTPIPQTSTTPSYQDSTTKTFKVYAQKASMENPFDTGIDLVDGDYIEINASGKWNIGVNTYGGTDTEIGPDGVDLGVKLDLPETGNSIPRMGGLAISIGTMNGGYIAVGSHFVHNIVWNGRLYLFCLDYTPEDNSGYITVQVKITKPVRI
jgi:hypothetical protein